jgi:hypothetical protein
MTPILEIVLRDLGALEEALNGCGKNFVKDKIGQSKIDRASTWRDMPVRPASARIEPLPNSGSSVGISAIHDQSPSR